MRTQGRQLIASSVACACLVVVCCAPAFALNPALDAGQFAHTAWKTRDGFTRGYIRSIAQTSDGYLWMATEFGLVRFDGVKSSSWQPPRGQTLPSAEINRLLTTRDGSLWIGTAKGLVRWKDGRLTGISQLAGQYILALAESRQGTVWVGTLALNDARICAIDGSSVECDGGAGRFGNVVVGLYEDSAGRLWAGVANGLWRWKPGPPEFHPMPGELDTVRSFAADSSGLLIGTLHGVRRLVERPEAYAFPGAPRQFNVRALLRDRDGGLWIGTADHGLLHVHDGRTDAFTRQDGLSGDSVLTLFEDREGDVWVATSSGLDRFRDVAVPTFGASQGMADVTISPVLAARDGSIWFGAQAVLQRRMTDGTAIGARDDRGRPIGLPSGLLEDRRGRIWVSTYEGVGYFDGGRLSWFRGAPAGSAVHAIGEDAEGNVWIASQDKGLFRLSRDSTMREFPWSTLGRRDFGTALVGDPAGRGVWIGFQDGGVIQFDHGRVLSSYSTTEGLGGGRVNSLRIGRDRAVWASTEGGLSRVNGGHVATLTSRDGLPCEGVHWTIEDDAHSDWLFMPCGLVRVAVADLEAWASSAENGKGPAPAVPTTVFDASDGVASLATALGYSPQVTKAVDGRIWFTSNEYGASVLDPRRLPFNAIPPPVHVERIVADRKDYELSDGHGAVRLPALTRDLQIDYTALSLVAPEKVRFRYKLEPWDREWQDTGNRRQAFYSKLPPGDYRFRLSASNNSGVWSEEAASVAFAVLPAYYQTAWFRILAASGIVLSLAALSQLRARRLARQLGIRFDERVAERTRIARDLHDTLLQSFQGLLLKFQAVTFLLPNRPEEARRTLESVIDQASTAISEGRDAVQGLRASTLTRSDLASAIGLLGQQLTDRAGPSAAALTVEVEGTPRDLAPVVRDEVYRIAGEAMRNALRHAAATRIEVDIHYDPRRFRLRIRDNGKGIEPSVLAARGRDRHFGLAGMHERTQLVGGKLAVWSERDSGCEIELTIPATFAYAKSAAMADTEGGRTP